MHVRLRTLAVGIASQLKQLTNSIIPFTVPVSAGLVSQVIQMLNTVIFCAVILLS